MSSFELASYQDVHSVHDASHPWVPPCLTLEEIRYRTLIIGDKMSFPHNGPARLMWPLLLILHNIHIPTSQLNGFGTFHLCFCARVTGGSSSPKRLTRREGYLHSALTRRLATDYGTCAYQKRARRFRPRPRSCCFSYLFRVRRQQSRILNSPTSVMTLAPHRRRQCCFSAESSLS